MAQAHRSDPGGDIETGIAFDADRLQRDRSVGAADQHIGADADGDGGAPRHAAIIAGERPWRDIGGRREHPPNQHAALRESDIDAELVDRAGIVLGRPAGAREGAADRLRGAKDKTPAAGDIAGQGADLHATLRMCELSEARNANHQSEQTDRPSQLPKHPRRPPFERHSRNRYERSEPLSRPEWRAARPR